MIFRYFLLAFFSYLFPIDQPYFILQKEYAISSNFITSDPLGNLYIVKPYEILKTGKGKDYERTYNNLSNGKISSIDTSDPFRIIVFYKDFNKIVFLNKDLSEITSPVEINDLGFYNVSTVCHSVNGGFWLFDQNLSQLVYFDKNLNVTKKSSLLNDLVNQNHDVSKVFMVEKNDYIYLGINGEEVLMFDSYGTYIKTFPLLYHNVFQVKNEIISFLKNEELCFYNQNSYEENCIKLPLQKTEQALMESNKVFVKTKDKVFIYQLNR